jgi:hypothetical protein
MARGQGRRWPAGGGRPVPDGQHRRAASSRFALSLWGCWFPSASPAGMPPRLRRSLGMAEFVRRRCRVAGGSVGRAIAAPGFIRGAGVQTETVPPRSRFLTFRRSTLALLFLACRTAADIPHRRSARSRRRRMVASPRLWDRRQPCRGLADATRRVTRTADAIRLVASTAIALISFGSVSRRHCRIRLVLRVGGLVPAPPFASVPDGHQRCAGDRADQRTAGASGSLGSLAGPPCPALWARRRLVMPLAAALRQTGRSS